MNILYYPPPLPSSDFVLGSSLRSSQHPDLGTMVENLTEVVIGDPRDIQYYIELAELAAEEEVREID